MAATSRRSSEATFDWSGRGGVVQEFLDHTTPCRRTSIAWNPYPSWFVLSTMRSSLHLLTAISFSIALTSSCTSPSSGPEAGRLLLDQAAGAMGGWPALDGVTSQEIRTIGMDWEPLQTSDPIADPRQINSFDQTVLVDYQLKRMRVTFDATRTYPTTAPVKFVEVIDRDVGMLEGTRERLHPSRLATRLRDYNRLPIRLLYTARNATDLMRSEDRTVENTQVHVLKYTDGGSPVELQLNMKDKLPVRVIYIEDDPVYGDTPNEIFFSDWKDHDGVAVPETQITRLNGKKIQEEHVRTVTNNTPIENAAFLIPAEVKSQPENGQRIVSQWVLRRAVMGVGYQDFGREQKVELAEVARGVYHVRGGSHHSMVVEMKDHLVVVEAPLFDERSVAVIRALEERFPGKPVRYLVITHFHFDHLGGVRAYVAKGVTLLAHKSIVPFISEMNDRPHTLRPDSLSKISEKPAVPYSGIEGVTDAKALSDGERTIELRSVENDHASGMLIVYLPQEKVVFVSDLYSPPGPAPNTSVIFERVRATAFYDYLIRSNLKVNTIVGGHGVVGSFNDLKKAVSRPE